MSDLKFVELVQANFICRLRKGCWGGVVHGLRLIIYTLEPKDKI